MAAVILFHGCDSQTPLKTLLRRRQRADGIITAWLASGVWMVESFACFMLLGISTLEMVVMLASTVVCLFTAVPAIVLMPLVGEFERELAARGALPTRYVAVEMRMSRYGIRMLLSAAIAVVAISAFHRLRM